VTRLLGTINFEDIGRDLLSQKPSDSVRQSFFQDFGICTNQNTSRTGEPLGIAKPRGKPGSKEKALLVTCSNVLRAIGFLGFDFDQERLLNFAGKLVAGNQIEAMRCAITDEFNLCGVHEDQKNDSEFPSVPVFSQYILLNGKQYRVSIIMYSRKSISSYQKRKNITYGPAVSFVMDIFANIPAERRSIQSGSFGSLKTQSSNCHGLPFSSLPCHMDPTFYLSPVIHFGIMIAFRFSLDMVELISAFRAWAAMPYTTYYFCSAIIILLQEEKLPVRGLLFGHFVLNLMHHLREEHKRLKINIPGLRFSNYRKVVIPKPDKWQTSTKEMVRLCLEACFRQVPPGEKKERARFYEETRKSIAKEIPNAGPLISNHLMGVLAIVGLVPLWFAAEHTVDTSSKPFVFLVKEKGLEKGKPAADRFLESLSSFLQTEHGITASRRFGENLSCKAFRMEKDRIAKETMTKNEESDHRFSDLAFDTQCIFQVVRGQVHVHRQGYKTVEVSGGLIARWALGGRVWTLPQLILQFESTAKNDFSIPKKLGGKNFVPNWMRGVFPRPFVVRKPNKVGAIVQSLLSKLQN
jgi:hypothetical protein